MASSSTSSTDVNMVRFHTSRNYLPTEVSEYIPPCFGPFHHSTLKACLVEDFRTWSSSITDMLLPDSDFKYEVTVRHQSKTDYAPYASSNRVIFMLVAMVPNRLALQLRRHRRFPNELSTPATLNATQEIDEVDEIDENAAPEFDPQTNCEKTMVTLCYYERNTCRSSSPPEAPGLFVYAVNLDDDDCVLNELYGSRSSQTHYDILIRKYYERKEFVSAYDVLSMYVPSTQCCANAFYFHEQQATPSTLPLFNHSSTPMSNTADVLSDPASTDIGTLFDAFYDASTTEDAPFDVDTFINKDYDAESLIDAQLSNPSTDTAQLSNPFAIDVSNPVANPVSNAASSSVDGSAPAQKRPRTAVSKSDWVLQYNQAEQAWCEASDAWLFYPNGVQISTLQPLLKATLDNAIFTFRQHRENLSAVCRVRSSQTETQESTQEFVDLQRQVASTWKMTLEIFRSQLREVHAPRYSAHMDFQAASDESLTIVTCLLSYMRERCGMNPLHPSAAGAFDVFLCKQNQIERAFNAQYQRPRSASARAGVLVPPLARLPHARLEERLLKLHDREFTSADQLSDAWPESDSFLQHRHELVQLRAVCKAFWAHELLCVVLPRVELYVPYKCFYLNVERLERLVASKVSKADEDLVKTLGSSLQVVQRQSEQRATLATRCSALTSSTLGTMKQTFLKKPHDAAVNAELWIRGGALRQLKSYAQVVSHLRSKYEEACCVRLVQSPHLYNEFLYLVVQLEIEMFHTDERGVSHMRFEEPTHHFFKKQNQQLAQNAHVLLTDLLTNSMRMNAKLPSSTTGPIEHHLPTPLKNGGKIKECPKGGSTRLWPLNFNFSADDINRQQTLLKKQSAEDCTRSLPAPTGRLRLVTKVLAYTTVNQEGQELEFEFCSPERATQQRVDAGLLDVAQRNACLQIANDTALCVKHEAFEMATKTRLGKFDKVCARLNMKMQG